MDRLYSLLAFVFYCIGVALFLWVFRSPINDLYEISLNGIESTATIIDSKVNTTRGRKGKTKTKYSHQIRYANNKIAWINLDRIYPNQTQLNVVYSKTDYTNVRVGFEGDSFYEHLKTKYGVVGIIAIILTLSFLFYNCLKWIYFFVINKPIVSAKNA
jgi:hypothetical protein